MKVSVVRWAGPLVVVAALFASACQVTTLPSDGVPEDPNPVVGGVEVPEYPGSLRSRWSGLDAQADFVDRLEASGLGTNMRFKLFDDVALIYRVTRNETTSDGVFHWAGEAGAFEAVVTVVHGQVFGSFPHESGNYGVRPYGDTHGVFEEVSSGTFSALTYNVAGLPEGLSGGNPAVNTPLIGPLLNDYDLVLLQESWKEPPPGENPTGATVYHQILEDASTLPFRSDSAPQPFNTDPRRPSAVISDGLNRFSNLGFPASVYREMWPGCEGLLDNASDCLAQKGFSVATHELAPGHEVVVYNLHMEAGGSELDRYWSRQYVLALIDHIYAYSGGKALIVAGDFNLHTSDQMSFDAESYNLLLSSTGLIDACETVNCPAPGRIDKFAYRSSTEVVLTPTQWRVDSSVFADAQGGPLSDHDPIVTEWTWSATN